MSGTEGEKGTLGDLGVLPVGTNDPNIVSPENREVGLIDQKSGEEVED